jgi:ApaG protein
VPRHYMSVTHGIRVRAQPTFSPAHSDPDEPRFVFAYRIRIDNTGTRAVQLMRRHWFIHDEVAGDSEVEGEGVIGEQPVLEPGGSHAYSSFCVLRGPAGSMDGRYRFRYLDGGEFDVEIPHMLLHAAAR